MKQQAQRKKEEEPAGAASPTPGVEHARPDPTSLDPHARLRVAASIYARAAIRAARAAALQTPPVEPPVHDDGQPTDAGMSSTCPEGE